MIAFCNKLILNKIYLTYNWAKRDFGLVIAGLIFLFTLLPINAAAASSDDLLQLLGNVATMRANFVQTTATKTRGAADGQKVTGEMALQRPGKFRWQIKQPMQQLIIATGKYAWVYDADLQQATKQIFSANELDRGNPAQLLSGDNTALRESFSVERLDSAEAVTINNVRATDKIDYFELRPKAKNNMYLRIRLLFVNAKLVSMMMEDNLGQVSNFAFTQVETNIQLSPEIFVFVPPKGVDVIDNS